MFVMGLQETFHLAAYPPPYEPPLHPPQQIHSTNPSPSFVHHYHSSFHAVAAVTTPINPVANYSGGYASQAAVHSGDFNFGNYHGYNLPSNARFEDYRSNPEPLPNSTGNMLLTNAAQQFSSHNLGTNEKIQDLGELSSGKSLKKAQIPQSICCKVCNIFCDTEDVLMKHISGKKHKHNLEKLKSAVVAPNSATPAPDAFNSSKLINAQTKRKKSASSGKSLKKAKNVPQSVHCNVCKIVCDTEDVLKKHISGKKHEHNLEKFKAVAPNSATPAPEAFNSSKLINEQTESQKSVSSGKSLKKAKISQSVCCNVCKIVCDTEDVLQKHRSGKKHKHNLEKLKAVVANQATSTPNSATPPLETLNLSKSINEQTKRKKSSRVADDLETKKKRVLECDAVMVAVRTCSICQVVCNSETVFQSHLAGKKHAAMVKKQASGETDVALVS